MKILSYIHDGLLDAGNIMVEMEIEEYLQIAEQILGNNVYQRSRIRRSNSIYSLLNNDLKQLCTIPTIVLALKTEYRLNHIYNFVTNTINEDAALDFLNPENLLILDGLQRTYTMLDVKKELQVLDVEKASSYLHHKVRVEVYVGISRTGILYRMLTLNTGQSPMSKRHEIEILYSDYNDEGKVGNVNVVKQVDVSSTKELGTYDFDDLVEGFNSFIDSDESPMTKEDIVTTAKQLEKITQDHEKKDQFNAFVQIYDSLVRHLDNISGSWSIRNIPPEQKPAFYYGDSVVAIMSKSQTMTGFGSAIGELVDKKEIIGLSSIADQINSVQLGDSSNHVWMSLLEHLNNLRKQAKKIGIEQRKFFRLFFIALFSTTSASRLNMDQSIELANTQFINSKSNDITIR